MSRESPTLQPSAIETGPAPEQGAVLRNLPVPMQLVVTRAARRDRPVETGSTRPWMPEKPLVIRSCGCR